MPEAPSGGQAPSRKVPVVSKDDLYFWTAGWQLSEFRAGADLKEGRYQTFDSADEAIRYLLRPDDR